MGELLIKIIREAIVCITVMALIVLFVGTVQAFIGGLRVMLSKSGTNHQRRAVWLQYSQWLTLGLTFQLAADIVETSIAPSWNDIGQLAMIAAIRTFLNYFLERDMGETRTEEREYFERQQKAGASSNSQSESGVANG